MEDELTIPTTDGDVAVVKTDIVVELKVVRADGTEEIIGEYPVYQAAEADAPSD